MGKKIKTEIDWSLDKGNDKGDIIMLAQHAQTNLGVVSFLGQAPTYDYYANEVNRYMEVSKQLHDEVLELPVLNNSIRYLLDNELLADIYQAGSGLVINLYLMYEHLAIHAGIALFRNRNRSRFKRYEELSLSEKIKDILSFLSISEMVESSGYGGLFSNIERARHAINHPKSSNIYTTDSDKWDEVPLAWFVSGRHIVECSKAIELYNDTRKKWFEYQENNKVPGSLILEGPLSFKNRAQVKNRKKKYE